MNVPLSSAPYLKRIAHTRIASSRVKGMTVQFTQEIGLKFILFSVWIEYNVTEN